VLEEVGRGDCQDLDLSGHYAEPYTLGSLRPAWKSPTGK
jgi:hypothetical protein